MAHAGDPGLGPLAGTVRFAGPASLLANPHSAIEPGKLPPLVRGGDFRPDRALVEWGWRP